MSSPILEELREQGCRYFQAQFIVEFLSRDYNPHHLLIAPTGTGQILTVKSLIHHLSEIRPSSRVLILTTRQAIAEQYVTQINTDMHATPIEFVDKRRFREMSSSASIRVPVWQPGTIIVMTQDLSKQNELLDSLGKVYWDLVIVDDADRIFTNQRVEIAERFLLTEAVDRLLLILSFDQSKHRVLRSIEQIDASISDQIAVTSWNRKLLDWDGEIIVRPPEAWQVLEYARTPSEVEFIEKLREASVTGPMKQDQLFRDLLRERIASSTYASEVSFERRLQRLGKEIDAAGESAEYQETWALLDELQRLNDDAKVQQLLDYVSQVKRHVGESTRICILSQYSDTISYLRTVLTEEGLDVYSLTAAEPYDTQSRVIQQFRNAGTILLMSDAVLQGWFNFGDIESVVHYDFPSAKTGLQHRVAYFVWPGMEDPPTMVAFHDTSEAAPWETERLKQHGILDHD